MESSKELSPFMKAYLFEQEIKKDKKRRQEESMYNSLLMGLTLLFGTVLLVMCFTSLIGNA
ncbi:MAG: hypothetical protein NC117_06860 [Pseudoflavonifractor sp.]|nr:hypothetical protein [Pseudoflavonifractor sp.]